MQFWIIKNGESIGPLTMEQLKAMKIDRMTKIWYETLPEWTPAENTPYADELFPQQTEEETAYTESGSPSDNNTEPLTTDENIKSESNETQYTSAAPDTPTIDTPISEEETSAGDEIYSESNENRQEPPAYDPNNYQTTTPPQYDPYRIFNRDDDEAYKSGYKKGLEDAKTFMSDSNAYTITKCPPSNLVWGILSTILCCLPIGIVAIVYASKVNSLYNQGEFLKAENASNKALYWSLGSAIAWLVTYPIFSALSFALSVL